MLKYIIIFISLNAYCGHLNEYNSKKSTLDSAIIGIMQVMSNKKSLQPNQAMKLVAAANISCAKYGIPVNVVLAIAFVESSYRLNAVNKGSNDYGIMQVNQYHVDRGADKQRLLTDLQYSFDQGVKVFSWFYKTYPLDQAIMRYNCGTRSSCVDLKSVKRYLRLVKKAL